MAGATGQVRQLEDSTRTAAQAAAALSPVRTVLDVTRGEQSTIWAAAGTAHSVFPTTYDELLRLTGAPPVTVAR